MMEKDIIFIFQKMKFKLHLNSAEISHLRNALKTFSDIEMRITEIEEVQEDNFEVNVFYMNSFSPTICFCLGQLFQKEIEKSISKTTKK